MPILTIGPATMLTDCVPVLQTGAVDPGGQHRAGDRQRIIFAGGRVQIVEGRAPGSGLDDHDGGGRGLNAGRRQRRQRRRRGREAVRVIAGRGHAVGVEAHGDRRRGSDVGFANWSCSSMLKKDKLGSPPGSSGRPASSVRGALWKPTCAVTFGFTMKGVGGLIAGRRKVQSDVGPHRPRAGASVFQRRRRHFVEVQELQLARRRD